MGKPVLKMFAGAIAGLLVWMIFEPQIPPNFNSSVGMQVEQDMVMWLGIAIGIAVGGFSGWQQGSRAHLLRGIVLGGIFGLVGVRLGAMFGYLILSAIGGSAVLDSASAPLLLRIPVRILALTPIGILLGAGIGASALNWRRIIQGAIGGGIGAGIGAALFDPISEALAPISMSLRHVQAGQAAEVGMFGRVALCLLMGAGIGLFIGIIENVAKVAWLRLAVGRNEGREWVVDAPVTVIGRSEIAQVPLFGDTAVDPKHASIHRRGEEYLLVDENSQTGTYLNDQRITQAPLFHGAVIRVGGYMLEFLMKVGTAPQRAAERLRAQGHYAYHGATAAPYGQAGIAVPFAAGPPHGPVAAPYNWDGTSSPPAQAAAGTPSTPSMPTIVAPAQVPSVGTETLVAISGPLTGQRFPIGSNLEVGREAAGIPLGFDASASRKHATLAPSPAGIIVTDLNSTNGTFVNDQKVQAASLVKGDLVRIGITTFRVE